MRQVVLDTETTGIDPAVGHRIIEIGCIELVERRLTGKDFHVYLNPQRQVDEGAMKVHGISNEFLEDKPFFADVVDDFIAFIDGAELIIHNAPFDVGFINAELRRLKWSKSLEALCTITDTLVLARKKHPGQRNSLDALCKRYEIDNSNRKLHGALLDSEILAFVYLAMTGGQHSLFVNDEGSAQKSAVGNDRVEKNLSNNSPVLFATADELSLHNDFMQMLDEMNR